MRNSGASGTRSRAGLAIGEHEILVDRIDLGQRRQQIAQINLGAADAARNEIQRVDADAHHLLAERGPERRAPAELLRIQRHRVLVLFRRLRPVALDVVDVAAGSSRSSRSAGPVLTAVARRPAPPDICPSCRTPCRCCEYTCASRSMRGRLLELCRCAWSDFPAQS